MTTEPFHLHVDNMKADVKVHFHEAQEHSSNSPSPAASPSSSDTESSPGYKTPAGKLHRAHSHNGHTRHDNTSNNAADKRIKQVEECQGPDEFFISVFVMQVRSDSSGSSNTFVGRLLTVSPADELVFQPQASGDPFDTIILTNTLSFPVAFKVKTTSPEKFRVRPSSGLIKPQKTEEVYVYLISEPTENVNREKFLVMAVDTQGGCGDANQLFKDTPKEMIMQHKLRCSFGPQSRLLEKNRSSLNVTVSEERLSLAAKNTNAAVTDTQPSNLQTLQSSSYIPESDISSSTSDLNDSDIFPSLTRVRPAASQHSTQVEQVDAQTQYMQQQLNLLLLIQFLTAFFLVLIMLSYSCVGEDLFTRFLALPFDFCHVAHGRRCT